MEKENEFIPYEQSLELKHLGFEYISTIFAYDQSRKLYTRDGIPHDFNIRGLLSAPTFSQAFRWFRDKYNLHHSISILQRSCRYHFKIRTIECESDLKPFGDNKIISEDGPRKKYEDIELDCLKKLIEIVKDGKK